MQAAKQSDWRIAITGTAFRFPGNADSPESYWDLLDSGRSAIRDTPPERFDIAPFYNSDPDAPGTTYSRQAGYVNGAFEFDADFFRISRAEALEMDPQQRWMLELCWSALENAGIVPSEIRGQNVGLFLASGEVDYGRRTVWSGDSSKITTYSGLGSNKAILAGRIAYFLGVHGPAIFVDTACSSSLTAVHLAAQSLHSGDCDITIAGGVNLILGPEGTITVARLQAMSRSETCRPFDAGANGYMRGEGGGVIVMKRLEDALSDGDRIDAILAGSAINNDGPSNGLTAPNGAAQERVIRSALQRANARPESIAYVEAHGTGTPLGDPIELTALRNVYSKDVRRTRPLLVGSVKAQIGHLESAAGMAGLIKAILVLRRRRVPAQANFSEPNPRFRWEGSQINVPQASETLLGEEPLVGVSGFGISGTNVHLLLARPPVPNAIAYASRDRVLTLSAQSHDGCVQLAKAYRQLLNDGGAAVRDICYTASVRRDHWNHRVALVGAMRGELVQALDDFINAEPTGTWHAAEVPKGQRRRLVFLFPGQGAWKPGIGAGLYKDNRLFNRFVNECLKRLDPTLATEVLSAIKGEHPEIVRHRHGQLAHFVFLYSLAKVWMELGQRPDVVIGHSLGEHVAAVIAGVMSVEDGLKAVEARGRLFDTQTPPGAMLATAASVKELHGLFEFGSDLFIAGINGPEQTVLSGTAEAVAKAEAKMMAMGRRVSRLNTYNTPGHTPLLSSMRTGFAAALSGLHFEPPTIQLISTLTGKTAADDIASVEHWLDLVERPVVFADALNQLADQDCIFLEVGPGAALSNLARAATKKWDQAISSLADSPDADESPEPTGFAHACAKLYSIGFMHNWAALYGDPPQPAQVPTYPFERTHLELPFVAENANFTEARTSDGRSPPAAHPQSNDVIAKGPATSATTDEAHARWRASNAHAIDVIRQIANSIATGPLVFDDNESLVALGFDSLALTELRARLQRTFGRALPVSLLTRGVSIAGLATFFGGKAKAASTDFPQAAPNTATLTAHGCDGDLDGQSIAVMLRKGTGEIIALVHPVGGDVFCYQELTAAWPGDPTVVGLRHPESDLPHLRTHRTLAELASLYCSELERVLGRLPDRLGGWSFGGLVAHEMAAHWEQAGRVSPPLLMIDSPLPTGEFSLKMKNVVGIRGGAPTPGAIDSLHLDARFLDLLNKDLGLDCLRERMDPADFARLTRLYASNVVALIAHCPSTIEAPISYALAARGSNGRTRNELIPHLRRLTRGSVSVGVFNDDHNSIVQPASAYRVAEFFSDANVNEATAAANGR
ncbi:type I polyketide synthase [Burkholderia sp. WSM2232]|uniref:type I polyketide synthase n=1 Tax=Burkholderia sp. WSM2232 TaxID=944436 RepID=UPI000420A9EB|nr:type I polyketide synthase [Burkholderia sp. WSM2232]